MISSPIGAAPPRSLNVNNNADYSPQGGSGSSTSCGIPSDATAYSVSLTILPTGASGFFRIYPSAGAWQDGNTVNFSTSGDITNDVIVKSSSVSPTDELDIYSSGSTNYVVDIVGYFAKQTASNFSCVNTSVSSLTIAASSVSFFNNPSCPTGYSAVTPYRWTAAAGVYSQGSGYNANASGNATFCSWKNTTVSPQTTFGGNVCCRTSGR